jgi:hypothetical protein
MSLDEWFPKNLTFQMVVIFKSSVVHEECWALEEQAH